MGPTFPEMETVGFAMLHPPYWDRLGFAICAPVSYQHLMLPSPLHLDRVVDKQ